MSVAEAHGWGSVVAIHGCIGCRVDGYTTPTMQIQWKKWNGNYYIGYIAGIKGYLSRYCSNCGRQRKRRWQLGLSRGLKIPSGTTQGVTRFRVLGSGFRV